MRFVVFHRLKYLQLILISLLAGSLQTRGQGMQDPVKWSLTVDSKSVRPGGEVLARLTANIQPGWHLYSLTTPKGGPNPTTVSLSANPIISGVRIYQPQPIRKMDPNFQLETETFEKQLPLLLEITLKHNAVAGAADLTAQVRYQCCADTTCLPPKRKVASATLLIDPSAKPEVISIPAGYNEVSATPSATTTSHRTDTPLAPLKAQTDQKSLLGFLVIAFGFGLAAIFTPCVFPMIPITVSFFLNQNSGGRRGGLAQAVAFCLGIVVLFTTLGLLMKSIAGPFGVVLLGSNPWVNGFISLVFVIFALSLLGAYELTLPSGLLTRLDRASRAGGYAGTLLMGLTFSLTSFACVGPIVGPLLVASIDTSGSRPVLGMLCFAAGLALPFFLLALFPSYLKRLPKSGGWMSRVKVVLGFVVLACALKYMSNVDQVLQTNVLTRERFLAAWMILFALPGLYLLGLLHMEGIRREERLGVPRAMCGALFLIFSLSLLPGLFGSPLGELDAYVPPAVASPSGLAGPASADNLKWLKNQYKDALAQAATENKLVLVNFTGYACTNCHWMKSNMFTRQDVRVALQSFVLVDLYTDGTDPESEKNQEFEQRLFSTVAIPFYAILDPQGRVLATFPGLTRKHAEFLAFLETPSRKRLDSFSGFKSERKRIG
ncbi:MAG TPA: cytochrome c biogenesis protein CcdA [Bryobacteraceae bacterium]|nr:cytochrome c biogenesis protein CcdA [Bryobacteraceae bacterium]